ncbi:nuclear transport factor 2 family protein [Streptosporangium sp. NPDC000396]|uniref:nuclear transport factor 2 family protein n=1 Tax=Streptosporangium sp. NPDC000396 TaxID=3366185 RepID=UPI003692E2F3
MADIDIRAAVERHWDASAAGNLAAEHSIYHDDVLVEYPQSGERIRGRKNIEELHRNNPVRPGFTVRRIIGSGDLWISECVLDHEGRPVNAVSIMEFEDGKVVHETQYFGDPFDPPAWRSRWNRQA